MPRGSRKPSDQQFQAFCKALAEEVQDIHVRDVLRGLVLQVSTSRLTYLGLERAGRRPRESKRMEPGQYRHDQGERHQLGRGSQSGNEVSIPRTQ